MVQKIFVFVYRHLAALFAIALATLIIRLLQNMLEADLIALLYLLPVMVSTVLWGLTPGLLAGFLAFLALNYFFIPPYYTFFVHQSQDLITLTIFLILAVVMSQLIGQAREGLRLAQSREWEATRMYELTSSLAGLQDIRAIAHALAKQTLETFQCDQVEVYIDARKDEPSLTIHAPETAGDRSDSGKAHPTSQADPSAPVSSDRAASAARPTVRIPLMTARGLEGEVRLWYARALLSPPERRLLDAYSSQGALAIERVRLSRGENKAQVLEESDRLKSALLNSVSHELRTPLAVLKASVSSLRSGAVDWDTGARQELLETVEEETDHLNLLVGNLLDMSRIEAGSLQPNKRWNSIAEIAMGVIAQMRKQLKDHRLEVDFPDHLPLVPSDYIMIGQVFTNLLSNSAKYAPPATTITLSARQEGENLHVRVANQGPPVPEESLSRIFDRFHRVTAADRVTGTGLGLSICKGIIQAHGGSIWAENQPCCFEFHITLPLKLDGALPHIPRDESNG